MRCNSLLIISLKLKVSEILEDSLVAVTPSLNKIKMNKKYQTLVCQVCWSKKSSREDDEGLEEQKQKQSLILKCTEKR